MIAPRRLKSLIAGALLLGLSVGTVATAQDHGHGGGDGHDHWCPCDWVAATGQRQRNTRPPHIERSRNLVKVGSLRLPGPTADVWSHKRFAYVGSKGDGMGVRIVDISRP